MNLHPSSTPVVAPYLFRHPRPLAGVIRLAAVAADVGDAAAPVGGEQVAGGVGKHAFGPHQGAADETQVAEPLCQATRAGGGVGGICGHRRVH